MFRSKDDLIVERLTNLMKEYMEMALGDWNKLRELIPPYECWRFYIDGSKQEQGKGIIRYFSDDVPECTIKEYAASEEDGKKDWHKANFLSFIRASKFNLSDKECENLTIRDLLKLDGAWLAFEKNESNYLKSLLLATEYAENNFTNLTTDFILELHKLALSDVQRVNYTRKGIRSLPGAWRIAKRMEFDLEPRDVTLAGIAEIIENTPKFPAENQQHLSLNFFCSGVYLGEFLLNTEGIGLLKTIPPEMPNGEKCDILKSCFESKDGTPLIDLMRAHENIRMVLNYLALSVDDKELAQKIFNIVTKFNRDTVVISIQSVQVQKTQAINQAVMEELIKNYKLSMGQAKTPYDTLLAIITYVQNCHKQHSFLDGNGRVFIMILLNCMLKTHGFPKAILENPGCFNAYSPKELVEIVLHGMENTLKLVKEKCLYNVDTLQVLKFLETTPVLKADYDYFKEAMEIEKRMRRKHVLKLT